MNTFTRREFLKISASSGAGLLVSISLPACSNGSTPPIAASGAFQANAWIHISPNNIATLSVAESEMGQGVMTSLPMLIAEELEMPLASVRFSRAPVHPAFGKQRTGSSSSVREAWPVLRRAGATVRELLIRAASQQWQVPQSDCVAEAGAVLHRASARTLRYGELLDAAARLDLPENVPLKKPAAFKLIGQATLTLDAPLKVTGRAIYGSDVQLPGMLYASVVHCPVFGGKVASFDATKSLAVSGVKQVVEISSGLAVVADNTWAAFRGAQALKIQWDQDKNAQISSQSIREDYWLHVDTPGETLAHHGEPANADVAHHISVDYQFPYQAHATMEPMNCTADVHDGECDIWAPTQAPNAAQDIAAKYVLSRPQQWLEKIKRRLTGNALQQIRVHTTFLGGGFGRRLMQDYVAEAVQISQAVKHPVKLSWTREEDIQHDYYRPLTVHRLTGGIDAQGRPVLWQHRVVGPNKGKSVDGARELPYDISNFQLDFINRPSPVPIGSWRSVGSSHTAFVIETFIDELAALTNADPLSFRLQSMDKSPRLQAVLKQVADKAGWGNTLPEGHFHGLAAHKSFGSFVAQVAEISIDSNSIIRVHRVTCAIDCGIAVNPNTIRAQLEGSIIFGLTASLKNTIEIKNGRVAQNNFHDFPILRMPEAPVVDVHIIPSEVAPSGVGEPAVPPIAPAVANAVFAATGKRMRSLPIRPQDLDAG